MNNDDQALRRTATRTTSLRILWMLVIVAAGVAAYFLLGALEGAKSAYDGERAAPLVIVDKEPGSKDLKQGELSAKEVKAKLPQSMQSFIDKIKHQNFRNANELLERLNEEILSAAAVNRKKSQDRIDSLNKTEITELSMYLGALIEAQKIQVNAATRKGVLASSDSKTPNGRVQSVEQRHDAFVRLSEEKQNELQGKIRQVDAEVSEQFRIVYTQFRPALLELVKSGTESESAFRSVLNDKTGSHVIYQVAWLGCVVVLVFGVLYVLLMLLRPLPPFAGGTEALTEQAKSFLSRRGGGASTPEFGRTIAVTVAALGIGTAVVVAGGAGGRKTGPVASVDYSDSEVGGNVYRPNNRYIDTNRPGTDTPRLPEIPAPIINLPPVEPSPVYYSPINRFTFAKPDETRLNQLSTAVNQLTDPMSGVDARLRNESARLSGEISMVDRKFGDVDVPALKALVTPLPEKVQTLETAANNLRTEFLVKLNTTSDMVEDLRVDNLERFRRPEGRNFFTRFKQFFGGEQYVVSPQAFKAVKNYMCDTVSVSCSAAGPCACGDDANKKCLQDQCKDPNAKMILDALEKLIYLKPMNKSEFLGKFDRPSLKPWETLILRYTRVPY